MSAIGVGHMELHSLNCINDLAAQIRCLTGMSDDFCRNSFLIQVFSESLAGLPATAVRDSVIVVKMPTLLLADRDR